jgi:plastocyanin
MLSSPPEVSMARLAWLAFTLAACGGGDGQTPDAKMVDAAVRVVEIGCPATPDATITEMDTSSSFSPMASTIPLNGIAKFVTSSTHNVVPNPLNNPEPALTVGFNMTKCFKFTVAGTYGFMCQPHGFTGTITVNP